MIVLIRNGRVYSINTYDNLSRIGGRFGNGYQGGVGVRRLKRLYEGLARN